MRRLELQPARVNSSTKTNSTMHDFISLWYTKYKATPPRMDSCLYGRPNTNKNTTMHGFMFLRYINTKTTLQPFMNPCLCGAASTKQHYNHAWIHVSKVHQYKNNTTTIHESVSLWCSKHKTTLQPYMDSCLYGKKYLEPPPHIKT